MSGRGPKGFICMVCHRLFYELEEAEVCEARHSARRAVRTPVVPVQRPPGAQPENILPADRPGRFIEGTGQPLPDPLLPSRAIIPGEN